jgi:RNA polymerase sigma factor (sigma-70 family)
MAPRPNPDELQQTRVRLLDEAMRSEKRQLWWQARKFSDNDQDADDALEDACVAFLRNFLPQPDDDEYPAKWLMITVKHAALTIRKHEAIRRRPHPEAGLPRPAGEGSSGDVLDPASTEERVLAREWTAGRADLLAELKPDERTALSLLGFGFSYLEIGERQGWSPRKVSRCIAEGRKSLRELLSQRGDRS